MNYKLIAALFFSFFLSCNNLEEGKKDQYVVNKTTTSCKCTVQLTTARPQLGNKFLGPFDSKEEAIREMCKNIDPSMTDTDKCWEVKPECP